MTVVDFKNLIPIKTIEKHYGPIVQNHHVTSKATKAKIRQLKQKRYANKTTVNSLEIKK